MIVSSSLDRTIPSKRFFRQFEVEVYDVSISMQAMGLDLTLFIDSSTVFTEKY